MPNLAELADEYLRFYDLKKELELEVKQVGERLNQTKEALLAELSASGLNSVGRNDRSITVHTRSFGKVGTSDKRLGFQDLQRWVEEESGEPISQYMELVFIKGSSSDPRGIYAMVQMAQEKSLETGKTVEECLPPGLEIATVPVVTVRSKRQSNGAKTAIDKLNELENDF